MEIKNYTGNGFYRDSNNKRHFCNAHLSYKGRSVIIDYEWSLHVYDADIDEKKLQISFLLKYILMQQAFIQDMQNLILDLEKLIQLI